MRAARIAAAVIRRRGVYSRLPLSCNQIAGASQSTWGCISLCVNSR
ncbi:hypothetical protein CLOSTMETH_02558 [[Clostridium] methylpentosum DSM 5476]|uniref:Uncharacterized protein n=1 Tax=[Clostridium] methylpentosum DSM 5476 TaxID=537013 RepID=C0EFB7_9FIRM|nr:hypothetical protein CLOSTMETH_02558 [[Clostridium] methylpentosum DSM 5476]